MASATKRARRERKLPKQQLAILAVCRFAEPIATTSLFPYLPEMIRSFGVPQNDVGEWAGTCAAAFSLSQALFGVAWGRFSDVHGRKPAILLGLTATMITSLVWGFSTNLAVAITARVLAGAGNGNVGIIRTTVAEMVPFKELQPRAFSLMPLVWNIGSIFGPTIGGALANPLNVQPGQDRSGGSLFERFPYALPNIVSAIFFSIGITTGLLYLEETLETKQGHRDYGLMLGRKLNASVQKCVAQIRKILRLRGQSSKAEQAETEPLIKPAGPDEERALPSAASETPRAPPPSWRQVLNYQAKMNLVTYTLLAGHTMAFDQLLPVFMQYPPLAPEFHQTNPIQFAGGFGLDHFTIGILSTCYGIFGMLVQFFLFPQIARRYGILGCLKWCVWIMPLCYLATPFTALLPTQKTQVAACFAIMLVKCLCGIFAFPCSTILLTNSASSLQVLGTLNGFATSCSAIGRALGPLLAGRVFSMGVKRGYIIAPWWLLAAVGFINILPVFYLVEGEGFGGDTNDEGEISDDDDDSETEDALHAQALEGGAEAAGGKPGPVFAPSTYTGDEEEEEGYGGVGPLLSRTTTRSSFGAVPAAEPNNGAAYMSPVRSRRGSRSEQGGRRVTRRVSIPLGLGGQVISRRYSSNLGQSLGSAGSFHE